MSAVVHGIVMRVHKPEIPSDSWYGLYITIGGEEYSFDYCYSVCEADPRMEGERIVKAFSELGVQVEHSGLYEYA